MLLFHLFKASDDAGSGIILPEAEVNILLISTCELQETGEIEAVGPNTYAFVLGIRNIAFLLDMCGNHQCRLAHVECLADRLEATRRGVSLTVGKALKEGLIIDKMERERIINLRDCLSTFLIPEEAEVYFRMLAVPGDDRIGKARIKNITRDVIAMMTWDVAHGSAEQWGTTVSLPSAASA